MTEVSCLLCNRRLNGPNQLRFHISAQHFHLLPYCCPRCDFRAPVLEFVQSHLIERGHGDKSEIIDETEKSAVQQILTDLIVTSCLAAPLVGETKLCEELKKLAETKVTLPTYNVIFDQIKNFVRLSAGQKFIKSTSILSKFPIWTRVKQPISFNSTISGVVEVPAESSQPTSCTSQTIQKNEVGIDRTESEKDLIDWNCTYCGKTFGYRAEVVQHRQGRRPPRLSCQACYHKFIYSRNGENLEKDEERFKLRKRKPLG